MKIILTYCFVFFCCLGSSAQESFHFEGSKRKVKLPFKLVNNLIILPIKVNGVLLNFLLDTGVEETILFSLDEKNEIPLYDVQKIKLKGLGKQEPIEGLRAFKNSLSLDNIQFKNQEIVVVLDQEFNFSSALGVEVNGIIGFHFFSQAVVKIDYEKKHIIVYNPKKYNPKKIFRRFKAFELNLEGSKPYIELQVQLNDTTFAAKCLIDSGNSDGLWLFQNQKGGNFIVVPERNFEDYLGRGFSGDIFGKKARVQALSLGDYIFNDVITAFPDAVSLVNLKMVENRLGSVGGDFLRRFNVIFDYQNKKMHLAKNKYFNDKFKYNSSGITLHHTGLQWYKEEIVIPAFEVSQENHYSQANNNNLKYNFKLLPIYEILSIRGNAPAEKVGLQAGDVLLKINGSRVYKMNLDEINTLLKVDDQREVVLVVVRDNKELTFRFRVVDLL